MEKKGGANSCDELRYFWGGRGRVRPRGRGGIYDEREEDNYNDVNDEEDEYDEAGWRVW